MPLLGRDVPETGSHLLCPPCPPLDVRPLTLSAWATRPLPGICRTLPLYAHQGWAAGTSLPHGEIPAPTKFQIPWPYRAPFSLTFDGLPSVGGRTSPPSERQWGEAPLSHHPSPLGVSWPCTWNTQVVGTERKSSRDFGGRVDIGADSDTWWSRGPVEPFQNGDATPK